MELAEAPRTRITGRLVVGVVVILIGIILLLDQLDVARAGELVRYLPALPLLLGLMLLTGIGVRRQVTAGVLVTAFSTWFLLRALGVISMSPGDCGRSSSWPSAGGSW